MMIYIKEGIDSTEGPRAERTMERSEYDAAQRRGLANTQNLGIRQPFPG